MWIRTDPETGQKLFDTRAPEQANRADLQKAYDIMMKHKIGKLPLVEKGKLVGLYSFTDVKALVDALGGGGNGSDAFSGVGSVVP